mmetsp:Transcript_13473/g.27537  ORF Transcript_13473/g.27537 Transcript_13473/m.27537 type:complete len:315 (-) Transcript_13473:334-1278(-)|eukprot:CAMPEP_0184681808 /NCGR_PEP_ID=MMETSP0312-20130426/4812_1 /TAXON_ID=31354 /ORGANISM="Compsopogon coeruleus, Strain SAG 36.94" /LENGTH=314 /DNA_ID=CAMNT_0027132907 /DNA_START=41 /DNA_END=985 /DNA_ORIENTATION=-
MAAVVEGLSGSLGGMFALTATYPLMTLTTRQQTLRKRRVPVESGGADDGAEVECASSMSWLAILRTMVYDEGMGALFAGWRTALIATSCSQGVYYFCYGVLRRLALARRMGREGSKGLSVAESIAVSSISGCVNVLINHPLWLITTRMQADRKSMSGVLRELRSDPDGFRAWYRGVGPALIMVVNPIVQFVFYERFVGIMARRRGSRKNFTALDLFCMGALAKLLATLVTYPMNVVKSRLQVGSSTDSTFNYRDSIDAIRRMFREGPLGFYKGVETKLLQSVLAASILFMVKGKAETAARFLLQSLATESRKLQ